MRAYFDLVSHARPTSARERKLVWLARLTWTAMRFARELLRLHPDIKLCLTICRLLPAGPCGMHAL